MCTIQFTDWEAGSSAQTVEFRLPLGDNPIVKLLSLNPMGALWRVGYRLSFFF